MRDTEPDPVSQRKRGIFIAAGRKKVFDTVNFVSITILLIGIILLISGYIASGYSELAAIGIGTIIGAIFIFIIGMFFIATEEMLEKRYKGDRVTDNKPLRRIK
ncbi:hypothetical protein [Schinkia azotoformans]|uniref:hypothetical protein n=1 Tax=Schinkia azotoformans TaxID=1454 RepID=UPI002DBA68AC|nr:hypothetical protein [Schinkia azotoformans]MEC1739915.1 hypothetical protein [Schinkia azotoformans]MEC1744327.1 hypothetical protein [Schinkia azotoformans]MEC1759245.1 hypothetical protein [Schinkia azotoformans]MEC1767649.1 hypothetical protein [Schinkia azotoformans]MEC1778111.1 hypothetical protein [Schinkia azotoformans]